MRIVLALLTLLLAGCTMPAHVPVAIRPALARDDAEGLAFKGDDLVRAALAGHGADPLGTVFRGKALTAHLRDDAETPAALREG